MRDLPEGFETGALLESLADGWDLDVETIEYAPVGFGSYHWVATGIGGTRRFVTVDDLDLKPWLGDTRRSVFDGLTRAFGSAAALRDAGLDFVVAPILTNDREPVRRIGERHTVALFPFIDGRSGRSFEYDTGDERAAAVGMLAQLHLATPAVEPIARRIDLQLPGRAWLESGLQDVNESWSGGPFSKPARNSLAAHASDVVDLLRLFDRLSLEIVRRSTPWVVTHGEPHPVNVIRTDVGYRLVDWDTVGLAPPERDLWMVVGETDDDATAYADATGHQPDEVTLDFFRLTWDLADLASFTNVLRSPHRESEDTLKAYNGLMKCVAIRGQWETLLS
jgi:spectinomycin phosphotransferase